MNRKYIYVVLFSTVVSTLLPACKKFVEIGPPETELIDKTVFEDPGMATAAMTAAYAKLVDNNITYELPLHTGLYSDELKNYSADIYLSVPLYTNSLSGGSVVAPPFWSRFYELIYQSNALIEGCGQSKSLATEVKNQLTGESLFLRAFSYFYLVNLYGDVPLIMTTDYNVNASVSRTSIQLVYDSVIADLIKASSLLNDEYVDRTSVATTFERVRPNKYAAAALLARVYLYDGKYAEAEAAASAVINNNSLYDTVPVNEVFLKNNREAIWQLPPSDNLTWFNTNEGREFILDAMPGNCTISDQLWNAFEVNDRRKVMWTGVYEENSQAFMYPFKYKVKFSSEITEYSTVLRLAEQYLIRAEARAQQGKLPEAKQDLDVIRTRAQLPTSAAATQQELLDAIMHERQVELFTEWGHRWLDLKRSDTLDSVMTAVAPLKGGTWTAYKQYWPIPRIDINNNPNLRQTPGY